MIVDCGVYAEGTRQGAGIPVDKALAYARTFPDGFVWLGMFEPSYEEFANVAADFGLNPLAVEDAVTAHERPKLDVYETNTFAVMRTLRYDDDTEAVETGQIMLFIGADFVITVRHGSGSELAQARARLERTPKLLGLGPSAVLYSVSDRIVDDYELAAAEIARDVLDIEHEVFSQDRETHYGRIYSLKRELLEFRQALAPLTGPLDRLAKGSVPRIERKTRTWFGDVQDHLLRCLDVVDGYDRLLSDALSADLAQLSNRQNEDMRKITAWVAIIAVPTMLAGIYGMNFEYMPELGWKFGYPLILTVMAVACGLLYRAFKKSGWL